MAEEIVGEHGEILATKWGRSKKEWEETGANWSRVKLSAEDKGFIEALTYAMGDDPVVARLLEIIERTQA